MIKDFLQQFFNAIKKYSANLFQEPVEILYLLISIAVLYLVYVLVLKLFLKKEKPNWRILYLLVIVPIFLLFSFLIVAIYLWCFTKFFSENPFQLTFLIIELVFLITSFSAFFILSKKFKFKELYKITGIPISTFEVNLFYSKFKKYFKILKLWFLLPIFSFIILFFCKDPNTLLSIVFDNSTSMGDEFHDQTRAISNTLNYINSNTDIVISYFPICDDCSELQDNLKNNIDDIISETDYDNLLGESEIFFDKNSAIRFIRSDELELSNIGSPLAETIWGNFLYTVSETKAKTYKNKHLIVISDGDGFILGKESLINFNIFEQNTEEAQLDDYFNKITLISLSQNGNNNFFNNALEHEFYDGSNLTNYKKALNEITKNYKKDWHFIFWLAFLYLIFVIPALLINPKKLF